MKNIFKFPLKLIALAALCFASVSGSSAGEFDGYWEGTIKSQEPDALSLDVQVQNVTVTENELRLTFSRNCPSRSKKEVWKFQGKIKPDGSIKIQQNKDYHGMSPAVPCRLWRNKYIVFEGKFKNKGYVGTIWSFGAAAGFFADVTLNKTDGSVKQNKKQSTKTNHAGAPGDSSDTPIEGEWTGYIKAEDARKCAFDKVKMSALVSGDRVKFNLTGAGYKKQPIIIEGKLKNNKSLNFYSQIRSGYGRSRHPVKVDAIIEKNLFKGSMYNGRYSSQICFSEFKLKNKKFAIAERKTKEKQKLETIAEVKRSKEELARQKLAEEKKRQEAEALAIKKKKRKEAAARAKKERKQKEAAAKAEREKQRKEAAARAEKERKQKEAAAKAARISLLNGYKENPKTAFIFDGSDRDINFLFNGSGDAANSVRNLEGKITFEKNYATVCAATKFKIDNELIDQVRLLFKRKGIGKTSVGIQFADCPTSGKNPADIIALERRSFLQANSKVLSSVFSSIENMPLEPLFKFDYNAYRSSLAQRASLSQEYLVALRSDTKPGYGMILFNKNARKICTPERAPKAVGKILSKLKKNSPISLKDMSVSKIEIDSVNNLFLKAKKNRCSAIFGTGSDLHKLVPALERDKIKFRVHHEWVASDILDKLGKQASSSTKAKSGDKDAQSDGEKASSSPAFQNGDKKSNEGVLSQKEMDLKAKEKELEQREREIRLLRQRSKKEEW